MEYQNLVIKIVWLEEADIVTVSGQQYLNGDFVLDDIFSGGGDF